MGILQFDKNAARLIGYLPKSLSRVFLILDKLTSPLVWGILLLALLVTREDAYKSFTLAVLIAVPAASLLKLMFKRQRPPTIYTKAMRIKSYSFPSSHAYAAALGCGYLVVSGVTENAIIFDLALIFLALVIGVSRIHVGAHYPSDVIAGWILGSAVIMVIASAVAS